MMPFPQTVTCSYQYRLLLPSIAYRQLVMFSRKVADEVATITLL